MISESTEQKLRTLLAAQSTYKPNADILDQVAEVSVLCFVGATCMGKTTLMDTLATTQKGFGKTRNFTSRPPREEDDQNRYYYFEHSDEGLQPIFDRIQSRELLQYNINPFSLYMYGSEADDYPHDYNLADIFSSSIDGFRGLGFGSLQIFTVVSKPDTWRHRFEQRFPPTDTQRTPRLQEAAQSLEWSLAQPTADHVFIANDTSPEAMATSVKSAIQGEIPDQTKAREYATACLTEIMSLLA